MAFCGGGLVLFSLNRRLFYFGYGFVVVIWLMVEKVKIF